MFVSIVMAVHNGAEFLQEAIDSILLQTYSDLEIIIINDGSTDRTKEMLDRINEERLTIIHLEKNRGAAHALNLGIERAKGDWIAIHDADDISCPNRIEEQVNYLNEYPDLAAAGSFIECITGNKNPIPQDQLKIFETVKNKIQTRQDVITELYHGCPLTHGSIIFSKTAFQNAGRYDPNLRIAYDYDLWTRLITIGPIENVPKKLYKYRRHGNSISSKDRILTTNELFYSFAKFIRHRCFRAKKPNIVVVGNRRGVNCFKVETKNSLNIISAIHRNEKAELIKSLRLCKQKKLDGIIIFDNFQHKNSVLQYLTNEGMELRKNLFVVCSWI